MSFHPRLPMLPAGRVVLTLSTVVAAAILLLAARLLPVEPGRWGATAPAYLQAQSGDGAPRPTTTVVSSEALPHVAGKRVTTVLVEFPPGGFSPEHHHAGSVSVYVLSGEIESQLGGGPAAIYTPGEMFFEPPGAVHVFARNPSATEPARLLAVFVHDEGAQLTTYH